jgi:hypothetical protein
MLVAGVAAIAGVLLAHYRGGGGTLAPLAGFYASLALVVAWMAVIALTVEG